MSEYLLDLFLFSSLYACMQEYRCVTTVKTNYDGSFEIAARRKIIALATKERAKLRVFEEVLKRKPVGDVAEGSKSYISVDSDSTSTKQEGGNLQAVDQSSHPEKGYPVADGGSSTVGRDRGASAREVVLEINARDEQDWNVVLETAKNSGAVSARVVLIFKYASDALKLYGCC